jgi:hypothetical protein
LNNTTIGTTTDAEGKFSLNISLTGKIELIASYIGYEKQSLIIENYDGKISIALKPQNNTLNEVVVKASKGDTFEKWGAIFKKLLLGTDAHFTSYCKIKNPEVLVFYFDKQANELAVFAKSSLIVENTATSYRLKMDFDIFRYSFNTDILQVDYTTFFEEIKYPKNREETVKTSRHKAYYGSQMHFMRSVYNNDLTNNGYKIYTYRSVKNAEKERVSKIIQEKLNTKERFQTSVVYDLNKLFQPRDTAEYYKIVMKQNDIASADTILTTLKKYVKIKRELSVVNFASKDSLMVNYQIFLDEKRTDVNQDNLNKWKAQSPEKRYGGATTVMFFLEDGGINVQSSGFYAENKLFLYGNMFDRRVSQLLPWDYEP